MGETGEGSVWKNISHNLLMGSMRTRRLKPPIDEMWAFTFNWLPNTNGIDSLSGVIYPLAC